MFSPGQVVIVLRDPVHRAIGTLLFCDADEPTRWRVTLTDSRGVKVDRWVRVDDLAEIPKVRHR